MNYDEIRTERIKELRSAEAAKGTLYFNSVFDDEQMELMFLELARLEKDANIREANIVINSPGGSTASLFALVDQIRRMQTRVSTFVMGRAYSAAAILLISGTGVRTASKRAEILLHEAAVDPGYAKASQHVRNAGRIDRINRMLKSIILERTKMTEAQVARYMDSNADEFITAQEALRYGIVDKII